MISSRSTRGRTRRARPPQLMDAGLSVLIRREGRDTVHFRLVLILTAAAACSGCPSFSGAPQQRQASRRQGESSSFLPFVSVEPSIVGWPHPKDCRRIRSGASATGLSVSFWDPWATSTRSNASMSRGSGKCGWMDRADPGGFSHGCGVTLSTPPALTRRGPRSLRRSRPGEGTPSQGRPVGRTHGPSFLVRPTRRVKRCERLSCCVPSLRLPGRG